MNSVIIALNVLKRLFKQKSSILFLLLLPLFSGMFVISVSGGGPGSKTKLGYVNRDSGTVGKEMIQFLKDSGKYSTVELKEEEIDGRIQDRDISAALIIPENLSNEINGVNKKGIKLITFRASLKSEELGGMVNYFLQSKAEGKVIKPDTEVQEAGAIPSETRIYLGFMMMIIMIFVGMCIGTVLEERKEKTFMRTFSAPVRPYEVILGKMSAYFIIGFIQMTVFLLLTNYVFGFKLGVPMGETVILMSAFLIAVLGIGIGASGIVNDNHKYVGLVTLVVVPATFLGGCFFPVSMLPASLQKVANILPQKWAMEGLEKLAAGENLANTVTEIGVLLLFGLVFFTFGTRTLKPSGEDL